MLLLFIRTSIINLIDLQVSDILIDICINIIVTFTTIIDAVAKASISSLTKTLLWK